MLVMYLESAHSAMGELGIAAQKYGNPLMFMTIGVEFPFGKTRGQNSFAGASY